MRILISIMAVCLFTLSCKQNTLHVDETVGKIIQVPQTDEINNFVCYDSIINNIEVVKLREPSNIFLYKVTKLLVDENNKYYIQNGNGSVLCYNQEGEYQVSYGQQGKGPGEYIEISDFCLFNNETICILADVSIMYYDKKSGDFIKKVKLDRNGQFYPSKISQAGENSFFIWDSNPPNVMNFDTDFLNLIKVNDKGKIIDKYFRRENFVIEIGHLRTSYDGGSWIRPYEGNNDIYKVSNDSIRKEYKIQFDNKLVPADFFRSKKQEPYVYLDEYFNSNFIKFIDNIMDTKEYFHFTFVGKDYVFYEVFFNKNTLESYIGKVSYRNPTINTTDSSHFYSYYQDIEIDSLIEMGDIFKNKITERIPNQSYIFKFTLK